MSKALFHLWTEKKKFKKFKKKKKKKINLNFLVNQKIDKFNAHCLYV